MKNKQPGTAFWERFKSHIEFTPYCWLWKGSKNWGGYGQVNMGGKNVRSVHKVAYELFHGSVPEGLQLDHLCRVRHCVNPAHLDAVTQRDNLLRGDGPTAKNARKTHCKHGHELSGDNLYAGTGRICRICKRHRERKKRARNRKSQ
jgi:hypothetical protein